MYDIDLSSNMVNISESTITMTFDETWHWLVNTWPTGAQVSNSGPFEHLVYLELFALSVWMFCYICLYRLWTVLTTEWLNRLYLLPSHQLWYRHPKDSLSLDELVLTFMANSIEMEWGIFLTCSYLKMRPDGHNTCSVSVTLPIWIFRKCQKCSIWQCRRQNNIGLWIVMVQLLYFSYFALSSSTSDESWNSELGETSSFGAL